MNLIWDWNGTLQDDLAYIYRLGVQPIFERYGQPCPSLEQYRNEVTADFMQFYWSHGIPANVTAHELNAIMMRRMSSEPPAPLFSDAIPTLEELGRRGYRQFIVTGYARAKLSSALDHHGVRGHFFAFTADVRDKPDAVSKMLEKWGLPAGAVMIGDMVGDADDAAKLGLPSFICPRGFHPPQKIQALVPVVPRMTIIPTLHDLLAYLP